MRSTHHELFPNRTAYEDNDSSALSAKDHNYA
jgi:hypothetical protein